MNNAPRLSIGLLLLGSFGALACSDDTESTMPSLGGSSTASNGGSSAANGGSSAGNGGSADAGFTQRGACGQRGSGTASTTSFDGFEEFYIVSDRGFGEDICVVRFPVTRQGDTPGGCEDCLWTHLVGYEMPSVIINVDGVCENSELGMDSAKIAEIVSSTPAYGFVSEYSGHNSVLMKYIDTTGSWEPNGNATWDMMTSEFRFVNPDGICAY